MKCNTCNEEKPAERFQTYKVAGRSYTRLQCTDCKVRRQQERRSKIADAVKTFKEASGCVKCSFNDPRALQFHHTSDDKEVNIADAVRAGWGLERVMGEIRKCIVVCANCHLILHADERLSVLSA